MNSNERCRYDIVLRWGSIVGHRAYHGYCGRREERVPELAMTSKVEFRLRSNISGNAESCWAPNCRAIAESATSAAHHPSRTYSSGRRAPFPLDRFLMKKKVFDLPLAPFNFMNPIQRQIRTWPSLTGTQNTESYYERTRVAWN